MKLNNPKKLVRLLLPFLLLSVLFSCSGKQPPQEETVSTKAETLPPAQPMADGLLTSSIGEYRIVYPKEGSSAELYRTLAELNSSLKQKFGKKLTLATDEKPTPDGTYEILVGKTNRSDSQAVYAELTRADDYEIRICGENLVVASLSPEGLEAALRALMAALPEGGEVFFPSSAQCSYRKNYDLKHLTLGGVAITEYSIIAGPDAGGVLAEQLSNAIRQKCGYLLPIFDTLGKGGEHCIYVGNTGATLPEDLTNATSRDQYYVGMKQGDLFLYGVDTASQNRAVEHFLAGLNELGVADTADLNCQDGVILSASGVITSMSFNLWVSQYSEERAARVVEMIRRYRPDTLGVQEANWRWMNKLTSELGEEYAYVGIGRDGGNTDEHSAVFYRTDRFELLDGGTKWLSDTPDEVSKYDGSEYIRIFSYAHLKDRTTGMEWMHVNTHLDYAADAVSLKQAKVLMNFISQYNHIPVLLSGDFNEKIGSQTISYILKSGMDNSSDAAVYPQLNNTDDSHSKTIDFIFVSQGDFLTYDYLVDTSKINGDYPSDHRPVIVRLELVTKS